MILLNINIVKIINNIFNLNFYIQKIIKLYFM